MKNKLKKIKHIFYFAVKNCKSILLFLLIFWGWELYEPHFMGLFDTHILPLFSGLTFSKITNSIFCVICFILGACLFSIYKKRYYLPFEIVPYGILLIFEYVKNRIWNNYIAFPDLFLGLGYTDILVILLGGTIVVVVFVRFLPISKKQDRISEVQQEFILDRPIESPDEDILDYKAIAKDAVNKINTIDSSKSCSIGLIAHWGMGKTSFLNILEKELPTENYITLKFNPRHSYEAKNIQKDFFDLLYSTLSQYDYRFTSSFRNYLKSINILVDNSLMSKVFNVHKIWDKDIEKEDVNNAIKRIKKRIVVIIDDFDRLVRDEIIEIFKLIDGNASFTNIIFISAYDKDYINQIIDNPSAKQQASFSDKFFTIEMPLPLRPYSKIYDYLLEQLIYLTNASEGQKNEYKEVLTNHIDILERYITTLRDVKRFLNMFVRPYLDVQEEVVFRDYFLLNLIKLKHIDDFYKVYCKKYINDGGFEHIGQYILNEEKECECNDILRVLFSKNSYSYRSINNKSAFPIYFYESVYDDMKIKDMKQIFTMPSMIDVHKYINNIDETRFESFITYIGSVNYLSFANIDQFDRYIDIVMYLISKGYDAISLSTVALDLVYKRASAEIQKTYEITDKDYHTFLHAKLKGGYPNFPLLIVRHIILGILNKEFYENIIVSHNEILCIACDSLEDSIKKEPTIGELHLNLLYNCIDSIDPNTRKCTFSKDMCDRVCESIKKNPKDYFSRFVRLGRVSISVDYNSIICEPLWEQIFGNREAIELYISTLDEKDVPKINLVRNFWELYKYNDYAPIEFENQGNVQEKIENHLVEETYKLHQLLDIKTRFEKDEKDRNDDPKKNNLYKQKYQAYLNQISDIGLYIKLNGTLQTEIRGVLSEISNSSKNTNNLDYLRNSY